MERRSYEEVPHTADRAVRVFGEDLAQLLKNAAAGLYAVMAPAPGEETAPIAARRIALEAPDAEALLVAWLSELLFYAESEGLVFERFAFAEVGPRRLSAEAFGRPAGGFEVMVKAVTYHGLEIAPVAGGLEATVVFDV